MSFALFYDGPVETGVMAAKQFLESLSKEISATEACK